MEEVKGSGCLIFIFAPFPSPSNGCASDWIGRREDRRRLPGNGSGGAAPSLGRCGSGSGGTAPILRLSP